LSFNTTVSYSKGLTQDVSTLCDLSTVNDDANGVTRCDQLLSIKTPDAVSGLVECNYATSELCQFTSKVNNNTFSEACVCGFSELGKSYCPRKHNNQYVWYPFYVLSRQSYSNKCHTLNRFTCHLNHGATILSQIAEVRRNSLYRADFYGAPDCSVNMLASTYLFSSYVIAALSLLVYIF